MGVLYTEYPKRPFGRRATDTVQETWKSVLGMKPDYEVVINIHIEENPAAPEVCCYIVFEVPTYFELNF